MEKTVAEDEVSSKRPFVWTRELNQRFEDVYDHLGHDNATPKNILELMNEPGLTHKNVNSHLQKHRDHLRKLGVIPQRKRYMKRSCRTAQDQNFVPLNGLENPTITFGDGDREMMINIGSTQMNNVPTGMEPNQSSGVWPGPNVQSSGLLLPVEDQPSMLPSLEQQLNKHLMDAVAVYNRIRRLRQTEDQNSALPRNSIPVENSFVLPALYQEDQNLVPLNGFDRQALSAQSLTQFQAAGLAPVMDQRSILNFGDDAITFSTFGDGDIQMMMMNIGSTQMNGDPTGLEPNQSTGVWPGHNNVQSNGLLLPEDDQPSILPSLTTNSIINIDDDDEDVTLEPPKKKKQRVGFQSVESSNVLKGLEETKEEENNGDPSEDDPWEALREIHGFALNCIDNSTF